MRCWPSLKRGIPFPQPLACPPNVDAKRSVSPQTPRNAARTPQGRVRTRVRCLRGNTAAKNRSRGALRSGRYASCLAGANLRISADAPRRKAEERFFSLRYRYRPLAIRICGISEGIISAWVWPPPQRKRRKFRGSGFCVTCVSGASAISVADIHETAVRRLVIPIGDARAGELMLTAVHHLLEPLRGDVPANALTD